MEQDIYCMKSMNSQENRKDISVAENLLQNLSDRISDRDPVSALPESEDYSGRVREHGCMQKIRGGIGDDCDGRRDKGSGSDGIS